MAEFKPISAFRSAVKAIAIAALCTTIALVLVRLKGEPPEEQVSAVATRLLPARPALHLIPVIELDVQPNALESDWSKALARHLNGQTEADVHAGRADVLSDRYAIEVDRFGKWHEGIGQALHYGRVTGKKAALALIVEEGDNDESKLELIEQIAGESNVTLVLIRRPARRKSILASE